MKREMYRNCHIYPGYGGWLWHHDNYDGAPIHSDGSPADRRCGEGKTVEDCKAEIDEMYAEGEMA